MKTIIIAFFTLAVSWFNCMATEYYVAVSGNDANAGTASAPWRTIQKAANTLVAGDIVRVRPGSYNERVTENTSGTAGNYITYLSDSPTNAVVFGFNISGSYIRVIGFQITHPSDLGYEAVRVSGGQHVEVLDNYIHNVSTSGAGSGITYGGASYLVVRGNTIAYTGSPGNNNGPGAKSIGNISGGSVPVLIEYNKISHTTDYLTPEGGYHIYRNNVLGPTTTSDFGGTPHVDGYQPNEGTTNSFMEANWHVDNAISDSHLYLDELRANHHITIIKNVSIRSGDTLLVQFRISTNHYVAHNTFGQVGYGPRGGPPSGGAFYVWDGSINNVSRNNIFTNCTVSASSLYALASGGAITSDHDLAWPIGNAAVKADPKFVNYAANNFTIQSTSPAIGAAGALTTVTSQSGSGTTFTVGEACWFYDGFGLTEGQKIYVGNDNNLTVTSVNYNTRTITVSSSFTWANGDSVGYAYLGSAPDIGAYEYGANLLTSATLSNSGNNYTVIPNGDTRFVVFYREGIPYATDTTSPFTANISSGVVTAKAYALNPQASPVITATNGTAPRPAPPENLRLVPN